MRKLNFLKTIVDLVWIFSLFTIPAIIILAVLFFIKGNNIDIPVKINGTLFNYEGVASKVYLVFSFISYLLIVFALYYFRKILHLFQQIKIFDNNVIEYFKKIGNLLIISAVIGYVVEIIYKIYSKEMTIQIGVNFYTIIFSVGLFSLVLSEIFSIAKQNKDEVDFTV